MYLTQLVLVQPLLSVMQLHKLTSFYGMGRARRHATVLGSALGYVRAAIL